MERANEPTTQMWTLFHGTSLQGRGQALEELRERGTSSTSSSRVRSSNPRVLSIKRTNLAPGTKVDERGESSRDLVIQLLIMLHPFLALICVLCTRNSLLLARPGRNCFRFINALLVNRHYKLIRQDGGGAFSFRSGAPQSCFVVA